MIKHVRKGTNLLEQVRHGAKTFYNANPYKNVKQLCIYVMLINS